LSRKVYSLGSSRHPRPMREIALSGGNAPVRLDDTSGPYTDPDAHLDLKRACRPCGSPGSRPRDCRSCRARRRCYRRSREEDPALGGPGSPACAAAACEPGRRVTQMHYARRGEITPEMEFIALPRASTRARARRGRAPRAIIRRNVNHPRPSR